MTAAVIALAAALAALGAVLAMGVLHRRSRRASEDRIGRALAGMGERMDDLARELREAIERVHADGLRATAIDELAGSLDLEEVLQRVAEAAATGPGVDAVVVRAADLDLHDVVVAVGIPEAQAELQVVSLSPDGRGARAVTLGYLYPDDAEPPGALRSGVAVPLEAGEEQVGMLIVYSHDPTPAVTPAALGRLEAVAQAAGPAIDAARRYREARQLADEDSLTGLANRRAFHEALTREIARAHRYDRRLTLLLLDLDDFKAVNDRIGHLAGDDVLAGAAERIRQAVRGADTPCRIGGDEFAVILPESTWVDAEGLYARIAAALERELQGDAGGITASAGIAELEPGDDGMSLFQRADVALYRAKERGKGTAA